MAFGKSIRTYWDGRWHDGDLAVMNAADHGIWPVSYTHLIRATIDATGHSHRRASDGVPQLIVKREDG